mmetsp:Transcript_11349/g.29012  ORF Transcript_11349/g.29012 Transcript_11349/m.29012 type:complete len:194 (-) Transcript_11349:199-780(-)
MFYLRRALAGDTEAIARLWHDSWHAGHAHLREIHPCLLDDRKLANFVELTPKHLSTGEHVLAVRADDSIAGFASVQAGVGSRLSEVTQLFVAPNEMGNGVAAPLLSAAEDILAQSDSHACVHALRANERACRFYLKHGWVETGRLDTKIATTLLRPGALHAVLFSHPWEQLRFEKRLSDGVHEKSIRQSIRQH